jgi:hypothetical protein
MTKHATIFGERRFYFIFWGENFNISENNIISFKAAKVLWSSATNQGKKTIKMNSVCFPFNFMNQPIL